MVKHDIGTKYYEIENDRIFYYLLTGMNFRQIAQKFYACNINKLIYRYKKLKNQLCLRNRKQLAYFAIVNDLVDISRLKYYL